MSMIFSVQDRQKTFEDILSITRQCSKKDNGFVIGVSAGSIVFANNLRGTPQLPYSSGAYLMKRKSLMDEMELIEVIF